MSRENYDNYDQEDLGYYAADHSASDAINSETMETKDPAINQHQNDSQRHKHTPDHFEDEDEVSDSFSSEENENDTSDPYFQKNASIAQDLDEDLKDEDEDKDDDEDDEDDEDFDNDANRRTLDESKAVEDEDEF